MNRVEAVLSRPSGDTETGKYGLIGNWAGTGSGFFGTYIPTISRSATPTSVTVDTADQAPGGGAGSPSTANLTASGFKVFASTTNSNNAFMSGNYTVHY